MNTVIWGNLLKDPYVSRAFSDKVQVTYMLQFEAAWTRGLEASHQVSSTAAAEALAAIHRFEPDMAALSNATEVDGLPIPELVRQLRASVGDDAKSAIHTGATSQDVLDTSLVLTVLPLLSLFETRMTAILSVLTELESRFGKRSLVGRTRMQAALPISVGHRIASWRRPLQSHLQAASGLKVTTARLQAGGPVGVRAFGRGGDTLLQSVAKELELSVSEVWHTERTTILELGHWLTKVAGSCAKLGRDIGLMALQGIDEVSLKGGGTSSAMPHKQNPVRAEILVALGTFVAGQNAILAQAMIHEQERSGTSLALEWMTLPAMLDALGSALTHSHALLLDITSLGTNPGT